jgi:hypothetical protein
MMCDCVRGTTPQHAADGARARRVWVVSFIDRLLGVFRLCGMKALTAQPMRIIFVLVSAACSAVGELKYCSECM